LAFRVRLEVFFESLNQDLIKKYVDLLQKQKVWQVAVGSLRTMLCYIWRYFRQLEKGVRSEI